MKQVEKTVTSAEEFSFGEIKYEKLGKYTYYIAETTPAKRRSQLAGRCQLLQRRIQSDRNGEG